MVESIKFGVNGPENRIVKASLGTHQYVLASLPNPEGYLPAVSAYLRDATTEAQGKNDPWGFITVQVYAGNIVPHPIFHSLQLSFDFLYRNSIGADSFIRHFAGGSGYTDIWSIHTHSIFGYGDIQDGAVFSPDVYGTPTIYIPFPDVTAQNAAAVAAAQAAATSENTANNRVDPQDPASVAAGHKRASDATLVTLKAGTLPRGWDYVLKRKAPRSTRTVRSPVMADTFSDVVNGDRTTRTVTLSYTTTVTQADGTVVSTPHVWSIEGYSEYMYVSPGDGRTLYSNWYIPQNEPVLNQDSVQFVADGRYGMGLLWSGTSEEDTSLVYENPLFVNLHGVAPQFVIDYRNAVHPTSVPPGSTIWNDSALTDSQKVSIVCYGPVKDDESLGMFGVTTGAQGVEVFGEATFRYTYATGAFVFVSWKDALPELKDQYGNVTRAGASVVIPLVGAWPGTTHIVRYSGIRWADVVTQAKYDNIAIRPPIPPAVDSRTEVQKFEYAVVSVIWP